MDNLPVLPGEGIHDLLLGSLLPTNLQPLVFTDGHTSANVNMIVSGRILPHIWAQMTSTDTKIDEILQHALTSIDSATKPNNVW